MPERRQRAWVTWTLVGVIVVLLVATFTIARAMAPGAQFGGTDSAAVTALAGNGVTPWFQPVFRVGSAEIESGLFAAQAALGGAVLGWAIGRLQSRREIRRLREGRPDAESAAGPAAESREG
ncbi:energy-coupling factor ABC transporter substrate-binding protein [Raineyella fluvialis]|uniref:Cobalt transporter n=1 Tax=Raineyella fluvialis TaxID=2662261 RepID=A0A5Q2FCR7_9ACTN|nr:energy-coupling factor ABC transporter substrate-binding protein [Raineyella fluvialis]QGF23547.1 cobalt transporter [Raineyella fluvialis]